MPFSIQPTIRQQILSDLNDAIACLAQQVRSAGMAAGHFNVFPQILNGLPRRHKIAIAADDDGHIIYVAVCETQQIDRDHNVDALLHLHRSARLQPA